MGESQVSENTQLDRLPPRRHVAFRVRVLHIDIPIYPMSDRVADRHGCEGLFCPQPFGIWIRKMASPAEQARILLHETLHAIFECYNLGDESRDQESICSTLDLALVKVLLDNPGFMERIAKALGPEPAAIV